MHKTRVYTTLPNLQIRQPRIAPWSGLLIGLLVLVICVGVSLSYGAASIGLETVLAAFTDFDGSAQHLIVRTVRLPRTVIAASVGAALALAGAIMQALTRNPLASPGILGINTGAALLIVGAVFLLGTASGSMTIWFAFLGATIATILVYLLGSVGRGGMTPLKLTVAGAALTALLSSLTQALLVLNERTLDEIRFWLAGSVADRSLDLYLQVLPYLVVGWLGALSLGRALTAISLGDQIAQGLGQRTGIVKIAAIGVVVLLAGSSVAIAGPIGFIGLVVPHLTRALVGADYRWVLPYAALLGAILLLLADIGARVLIFPNEVPVGVVTALLGAPFLISVARRRRFQ
jgi:iron complex transport system permease protein